MNWWENKSSLEIKNGKLWFANRCIEDIAREHGTPLYIYDVNQFAGNYQKVRDIMTSYAANRLDIRVYYAMKANGASQFLQRLQKMNGYVDVSSIQEAKKALAEGFDPEHLIFTGTNFGLDGFEWLASSGILINVDSFSQLKRLKPYAPMKISIRLNTSVSGVGFNEKFDMSGNTIGASRLGIYHDRIIEAFLTAREWGFEPVGLHQHAGSNWLRKSSFEAYMRSVQVAIDTVKQLENLGFNLDMLNFGGGLGVRSHEKYPEFPLEQFAETLIDTVVKAQLNIKYLAIEPGRYIASNTGVLVATTNMVETKHKTNFLGIDIGFNAFHHKFLYQIDNTIINASKSDAQKETQYAVVGYLGESGDIFSEKEAMPVAEEGDAIVLFPAGAYCASELAEHHYLPIPKEIFFENPQEVDPLSLLSFCKKCPHNCCYGAIVNVTDEEFKQIASQTGRSDIFTRNDNGVMQIVNAPGEPCVFFNTETRSCGIQSFKPLECRAYPLMTGRKRGEYELAAKCAARTHLTEQYITSAKLSLDQIPESTQKRFYQINKKTGFIS